MLSHEGERRRGRRRGVPGEGEGADRRERADGVNALPPSGAGRKEDSFEGVACFRGNANRESRNASGCPTLRHERIES